MADDIFNLPETLKKFGICADAFVFESAASTNTLALKMLQNRLKCGNVKPFAVCAAEQTAGRGRLGRKWVSMRKASLCISAVVPVARLAKAPESFTVRAGLACCKNFRAAFGADVFVKWPNDIYSADGKKICGMLSEFAASQNEKDEHWVIFGAGVNCDFSKNEPPPEIASICADLKSCVPPQRADFSVCEISVQVMKAALQAARETSDASPNLAENFAAADFFKNKFVKIEIGNRIISGIARGVDKFGKLKVETENGLIETLCGGEATVVKNSTH